MWHSMNIQSTCNGVLRGRNQLINLFISSSRSSMTVSACWNAPCQHAMESDANDLVLVCRCNWRRRSTGEHSEYDDSARQITLSAACTTWEENLSCLDVRPCALSHHPPGPKTAAKIDFEKLKEKKSNFWAFGTRMGSSQVSTSAVQVNTSHEKFLPVDSSGLKSQNMRHVRHLLASFSDSEDAAPHSLSGIRPEINVP